VSACPETAIRIEIVNVAEWKREYAANANAPGLPSADDSISSTRITLPDNLPPDTRKADFFRVRPEDPHWPLVAMTVLTQLSVGAFVTVWLLQLFGKTARLGLAALVSLLVAGLALSASTLHLGRPMYAYRALKMWKRSWLSREVLLFGCFSGVAFLYAALLWFELPGSLAIGALTSVLGAAGVTASAGIYLGRGYIDPGLAMPVMLGVLAGAFVGSRLLVVAHTATLRVLLAVVIVALAVQMTLHGLAGWI